MCIVNLLNRAKDFRRNEPRPWDITPTRGLTANTNYRYQVRATDAAGNLSVASATTMATTLPACMVTQSFASLADDKILYKVTNTGNTVVTLDTLSLNFPSARQRIKLVQVCVFR